MSSPLRLGRRLEMRFLGPLAVVGADPTSGAELCDGDTCLASLGAEGAPSSYDRTVSAEGPVALAPGARVFASLRLTRLPHASLRR
jgi:hypothetical protein